MRGALGIAAVVTLCVAGCDTAPTTFHGSVNPGVSPSTPITTPPTVMSSPPPTPTPSPTGTVLSESQCVADTMAKMTLRQQVGQLLLVGTPIADPSSVDSVVRAYAVGGVFLAGRSHESASQLRSAIRSLQGQAPKGVGLLIALDQEGGEVQTLQGADFPPIPTAVAQGQLSQSTLRAQTVSWAQRLASIGVTLDLAPVADTVPSSLGTGNPPIGAFYREYGSDPTKVAADIGTVVGAIQSTGVTTTLKHFPGLGRVLKNTDTSTGAVDTVMTSHDPYLGPFIAGVHAGTGAVMVSSASYPNLDPHAIAAFSSPIVTGLLRDQLGFGGLIVSDDLGAAVAVSGVPVDQRGVRFVAAGGDVALTVQASKAPAMIDGLVAAAQASASFTAKVIAAARIVIRSKYASGLLACSPRQP
jgi:beta-N-acetylhexosaminidase